MPNSNTSSNSLNSNFIANERKKRGEAHETRRKKVLNPENTNSNSNNNSNIFGLRFFEEPTGKPPKHPGAPKGPITPRNRRGRPRNIQVYPEIHYKPLTVANAFKNRFKNAKTLREKTHINLNFKKSMVFGVEEPKTWMEIQRMPVREFLRWVKTLPADEKALLKQYI